MNVSPLQALDAQPDPDPDPNAPSPTRTLAAASAGVICCLASCSMLRYNMTTAPSRVVLRLRTALPASFAALVVGGLAPAARAQTPGWPGNGEQASKVLDVDDAEPDVVAAAPTPKTGLEFVGVLDLKPTVSDLTTGSAYANGQLVGTLGGTNSTAVQDPADVPGFAVEQRVGTFFKYTPKLLDGRATLGAAFEVDFAWGDSSYGTGGNTGGGFGADQVNLQTRRLYGKFRLWGKPGTVGASHSRADLVAGLQFVGDGVYDPETARLDDLERSGGHLLFFGTEAAGLTLYGVQSDVLRYRAGAYTLYEDVLSDPDDVTLWMGDVEWRPAFAVRLGVHGWYLRDRAGGTAGPINASGPASALSELQGGPRLDLRTDTSATSTEAAPSTSAALVWLGGDASYNAGLDQGRFGATGSLFLNSGRLYVIGKPDVPVLGVLFDGEARARWAPGAGSVVRLEALYASGDAAGDEGHKTGAPYGGIVTGNSYGVAAASWTTHGCLLLFPDPTAINRQVAVVYDPSNGGAGVVGGSASVGYDVLPNKLTVTAGAGYAQPTVGGGAGMHGTEANVHVSGHPFPLATLSVAGAVVVGSGFDRDPWVVTSSFQWIVL